MVLQYTHIASRKLILGAQGCFRRAWTKKRKEPARFFAFSV